jgi:hypothetical protein
MDFPVARLQILDKRADDYIATHGFGVDYPFSVPKDVAPYAGEGQESSSGQPQWLYEGIEILPALQAAILARQLNPPDMLLANWNKAHSTYWKEVLPPGWPQVRYLKYYDARAGQYGEARSKYNLGENPHFQLMLIRSAPPPGETVTPLVSITLNCQGPVQYRLNLPYQDASHSYPVLEKSVNGGANWAEVDRFQNASSLRSGGENGASWVQWSTFSPYIIIRFSGASNEWVYQEENLDISSGPVSVYAQGGAMAFNLSEMNFSTMGFARQPEYVAFPDFVNTDEMGNHAIDEVPDGCGVLVATETDPDDETRKRLRLGMLGPGYTTPIVYLVQEYSNPILGGADDSVIFDNADEGWSGRLFKASVDVADSWRGSTANFSVRNDDGALQLTGNEKVIFDVAVDGGGGPSWVTQFVGYVTEVKTSVDSEGLHTLLDITAKDITFRLERKACYGMPSFGGWTVADAFRYLCRRWGVPEGDILVDEEAEKDFLAFLKGGRSLAFPPDTPAIRALDEIAKSSGREWGIYQGGGDSGNIFLRRKESDSYTGGVDFVLDEETASEADVISAGITATQEMSDFRNHILYIGRDRQGNPVQAIYRNQDSVDNPGDPTFVGADLWYVGNASESEQPDLLCWLKAIELSRFKQVIEWETSLKPDLLPGQFVQVNVSNLGAASGTVFKILKKTVTLDGSPQGSCRFTGGVV